MINQYQLKGFFRDVKCPECKEELQMANCGNINTPFQLNGEHPKQGCVDFHNNLNAEWNKYKLDLLSDADFQIWLDQYRDLH